MTDTGTHKQIEFVTIGGEDIPIHSPKLDDFCKPNGDLVLPLDTTRALVIKGWRDSVRRSVQ